MFHSPFGEDESDFESLISQFEYLFPMLKDFFDEDFEIVYFTYTGEYTVTMWKYQGGKLMRSKGWIGDYCLSIEDADDDDADAAKNEFVDDNYQDLKEGYPSDELLDGLRSKLTEYE
jgi:hypothetical protein